MQIGIRELRGKCVRGEPSRASLFCRLWGTQDGAWKRASVRGAGRLRRIIHETREGFRTHGGGTRGGEDYEVVDTDRSRRPIAGC